MSKAFTREDDDAPVAAQRRLGVAVPVPNPVTAAGVAALRRELDACTDPERSRELTDHLSTAESVAPTPDVVGFGAVVALASGRRYRIVGAIEAAPKDGAISWQSPIARALLGARVGDAVTLPRGEDEIASIEY